MGTRARAAALALALLLLPNATIADDRRAGCDEIASMRDDACKAKREKPKFQTKFFSD